MAKFSSQAPEGATVVPGLTSLEALKSPLLPGWNKNLASQLQGMETGAVGGGPAAAAFYVHARNPVDVTSAGGSKLIRSMLQDAEEEVAEEAYGAGAPSLADLQTQLGQVSQAEKKLVTQQGKIGALQQELQQLSQQPVIGGQQVFEGSQMMPTTYHRAGDPALTRQQEIVAELQKLLDPGTYQGFGKHSKEALGALEDITPGAPGSMGKLELPAQGARRQAMLQAERDVAGYRSGELPEIETPPYSVAKKPEEMKKIFGKQQTPAAPPRQKPAAGGAVKPESGAAKPMAPQPVDKPDWVPQQDWDLLTPEMQVAVGRKRVPLDAETEAALAGLPKQQADAVRDLLVSMQDEASPAITGLDELFGENVTVPAVGEHFARMESKTARLAGEKAEIRAGAAQRKAFKQRSAQPSATRKKVGMMGDSVQNRQRQAKIDKLDAQRRDWELEADRLDRMAMEDPNMGEILRQRADKARAKASKYADKAQMLASGVRPYREISEKQLKKQIKKQLPRLKKAKKRVPERSISFERKPVDDMLVKELHPLYTRHATEAREALTNRKTSLTRQIEARTAAAQKKVGQKLRADNITPPLGPRAALWRPAPPIKPVKGTVPGNWEGVADLSSTNIDALTKADLPKMKQIMDTGAFRQSKTGEFGSAVLGNYKQYQELAEAFENKYFQLASKGDEVFVMNPSLDVYAPIVGPATKQNRAAIAAALSAFPASVRAGVLTSRERRT
jgi:hypothetical protein